ncbi:MAG: copper amine oxidase N-terminal domain-containing protein [Tepidibacillus sp.]
MYRRKQKWLQVVMILFLLFGLFRQPIFALDNTGQGTSQVETPLVSVTSNHIKKNGAYQMVFRLGNTSHSALDGSQNLNQKNSETISIRFPNDTGIPTSIINLNVSINGEVIDAAAGNIVIDSSQRIITIPVPTKISIPSQGYVRVDIAQEAGITNPTSAGKYSLSVKTSKDQEWQESSPYSILDSVITVPEVIVSPNIIGKAGAYFIHFQVSQEGGLGNQDQIFIRFPQGTILPASIDTREVKVNDQTLSSYPRIINGDTLQLQIPSSLQIPNGGEVRIWISTNANIKHPATKGQYSLFISTSQDTVESRSSTYEIAESVNDVKVWLSPDIAGEVGQYLIGLTNGNAPLKGIENDSIMIQFPTGTELPLTLSKNNVYLNGQNIEYDTDIKIDRSNLAITLTLPSTMEIMSNQYVSILFTKEAGIINPLTLGQYTLQVRSNEETAYLTSTLYQIKGNHITQPNVQILEGSKSLNGEYIIQFKVSESGGLVGGQDTITILFPIGTAIPSSIDLNYIQINQKKLTQNPRVSGSNLILTIPNGMIIPSTGDIEIYIAPEANIKNPNISGTYTLSIYTNRDPVGMKSNTYDVGEAISTPNVSVSPNTYQSAAQYVIGFYTSPTGAITSENDFIEIIFPNDTSVPTWISTGYVTINGITARAVQVTKQTVKVSLSSSIKIQNGEYTSVIFSPLAGIKNPSASSSHRLRVRTSKDTSFVPSQTYTTVGASNNSGIPTSPQNPINNQLDLQLSSNSAGALTQYHLSYKTSNTGVLQGGIDEITITFPSEIELPAFISRELIQVNQVQIDSGLVRKSGNSIIFRLPTRVNVGNQEWISILIDQRAEIKLPNKGGTYSISLKTTKDTTAVSSSFSVVGQTPAKFVVLPQYNQSQKITKYEMNFTTSSQGKLEGGIDWIELWLPMSFSQTQFLEKFNMKVNGYTVSPQTIEVSGQTVTFLLPYQIDIPNSGSAKIVLEDSSSALMPNKTTTYLFKIATSKDSSWIDSNPISVYGSSNSGSQNNGGQQTLNSSNSKTIRLYLSQSNAYVNGSKVQLEAPPQLIKGNTVVPLRFVSEVLGGTVDYRSDEKRIVIVFDDDYLVLTLGSDTVYTKDHVVKLPIPATTVNGRTLVPLRFVSEQMGLYVDWNGNDRSITIQK